MRATTHSLNNAAHAPVVLDAKGNLEFTDEVHDQFLMSEIKLIVNGVISGYKNVSDTKKAVVPVLKRTSRHSSIKALDNFVEEKFAKSEFTKSETAKSGKNKRTTTQQGPTYRSSNEEREDFARSVHESQLDYKGNLDVYMESFIHLIRDNCKIVLRRRQKQLLVRYLLSFGGFFLAAGILLWFATYTLMLGHLTLFVQQAYEKNRTIPDSEIDYHFGQTAFGHRLVTRWTVDRLNEYLANYVYLTADGRPSFGIFEHIRVIITCAIPTLINIFVIGAIVEPIVVRFALHLTDLEDHLQKEM